MSDAERDENFVPTMVGSDPTVVTTLNRVEANPSNSNGMQINDDTTGSDNGPTNAERDANFVTGLMAVSSADGITPVALYVNSDGELLVDST